MISDIQSEIIKLKKEKGVTIFAHTYQSHDIIEVADVVGDSFFLSKKAKEDKNPIAIVCGVHFMAETVKMLSPEKRSYYRSFNKWRNSIYFSFGYDPLKCHSCGKTMSLIDIFHHGFLVPLSESFRMALEKYHYSNISSF